MVSLLLPSPKQTYKNQSIVYLSITEEQECSDSLADTRKNSLFHSFPASWLRDVFSYDFRAYSIKELTEALQEVGFLRVSVHVLPRNIIDRDQESESDSSSSEDEDEEGEGLGNFLTRTEKEERNRSSYRALKEGEKLFADRSFSSE